MSAAGFADPVLQSQATFRAVLKAMSRPGTIVEAGGGLASPAPLPPAAAAALLTLADYETPLWLSQNFSQGEIGGWLRFQTGAPSASAPNTASFALIDLERDHLRLDEFSAGVAAYPDRSTTIVAVCASLSALGPWRLSGPGVRGETPFGFAPFSENFVEQWRVNGETFPLGVDLILCCGTRLAALPRTIRIAGAA